MAKITSYRQARAVQSKYREYLLSLNPNLNDESGIYFLTRFENGFKYGYIGQAKRILTRLVSHMMGYEQHIDKSLKKHKFASKENPTGWNVNCLNFPEDKLNEKEQYYIQLYANAGYQLRNKTSGSQDGAKFGISENRSSKGYYDGLKQGYKNAQKDVAKLFEKNLVYAINGKTNKLKERAYEKFKEFIGGGNGMCKTDDGESKD